MGKVRVPVLGTIGKSVRVNPDATIGGTLGVNLFDEEGNLLVLEDFSAGDSGVDTLVALLDTNLSGQLARDLLFNVDGTEWQATAGALQWNPTGAYLQLANANSINWQDDVGATTELLVLGGANPDPDFANVVFLSDGEGTDGDTTITGQANGHVATAFTQGANTAARVRTAQSKFGASSLYVSNNDGATFAYFTVPDHNDFDLGSGDFTFEAHVRFDRLDTDYNILSKWLFPERSWSFRLPGAGVTQMQFQASSTGSNDVSALTQNVSGTTAIDVWYHYAWVRSGNLIYYFRDGVQVGTAQAFSSTLFSSTQDVKIGNSNSGNFNAGFYIDNLRLTVGVARYTADFTPPTAPYDDGTETFIVGDPDIKTQIDGVSTRIASAATTLDGTLTVVGSAALNAALSVVGSTDLSSTLNVDGLSDFNANVRLNSGAGLIIFDATGADEIQIAHDGTDVNFTHVGTTDWNITGLTSIQAGTVDVDFDAITATSYEGIGGANLVSSAGAETITGGWTFTQILALAASVAGQASINLPEGAAPTAPNNGDVWVTAADIFARINGISESLIFRPPVVATTAELVAIANAINTTVLKVAGYEVFNTTTGAPVWAVGDTDGAVWNDATGALAHTPA